MKVKAFATDVDGTITDNHHHMLNLNAVQTIRWLESLGFPVIISTGRGPHAAMTLCGYIGTCGVYSSENGGVVGQRAKTIILGNKERAEKGLKILKEKFKDEVRFPEEGWGRYPADYRVTLIVLEPTFDFGLANRILREKGIPARVLDCGGVYNLVDNNINKGVGIKKAAEILGLNVKEIVAIGDNPNDIDMFKVAGYAIAVGQAPENVKKYADYVCEKGFGDGFCEGVGYALKKFRT